MKFVLAPFGSRGDVEPLVALGERLYARGHEVVLCAPVNFRALAEETGLQFSASGGDFGGNFDGSQSNERVFLDSLREAPAQFESVAGAARNADAIVGSALQFAAPSVAQAREIPYFYAIFSPMYLRSVELPPLAIDAKQLPRVLHRALWALEDASLRTHMRWLSQKRSELGLPRITSPHRYLVNSGKVLGAFDPVLAPAPLDAPPDHVTGYWRRGDTRELPDRVRHFLAGGDAPVYAGFGSMRHRDSLRFMRTVVRSITGLGRRVVLARGWAGAGLELAGDVCLVVDEVPHDALFPQVAAVVHHGGAGTTTAAALSGAPQLIVPHLGDQFYHGRRVADLGIGTEPLPLKSLNEVRLSRSIERLVQDPVLHRRAHAFGVAMRGREGSAAAAEIIERAAAGITP